MMDFIVTPEIVTPTPEIHANISLPHFEPLASESHTATQSQCLKPYAAYDIGSGGTKYTGAIVNVCDLTIEQVFSQGSIPVAYRQDLLESTNNEFSDLIQEMGLNALSKAKGQIELDFHTKVATNYENKGIAIDKDIQHYGVATAAFREAKNGDAVAAQFEMKLDMSINIISQEEEGILGYYSALTKIDQSLDAKKPVVWDIGGGSLQITYKDGSGQFHVLQEDLASQTFQTLVTEQLFGKGPSESPNPMNQADVQGAIELAKQNLEFHSGTLEIVAKQIEMGAPILAIGTVHNNSILPACKIAGIHPNEGFYTKEDVYHAISFLTGKTDDEIMHLVSIPKKDFAKNQVTNLILVYAVMDMMGIDKVSTIQCNNGEGLMLQKAVTNGVQPAVRTNEMNSTSLFSPIDFHTEFHIL